MSIRLCFASVFFLTILTNFKSYGQEKPKYIYHICPNTTTFTRNSSYFTNLQTLLSSLSSDSASYSIGFQSAASGQSPDLVIGLFLCRGDLSPEICRDCVGFAVNDTLSRCPEGKESLIWYDECMLRYSNRNILLDPVTRGGVILMNVQKVAENQSSRFNHVMFSMMNKSAEEAANSSRKFAVNKSNFTSSQTLYGLVQCTPDLTRQDCFSCLQQSINGLPRDRIGGRLLWPSCNSRYERYPFYNETAFAPPSPPSGKGKTSTAIIIAIVVPIVVVVLLLIAVYSFYSRKAKKKTYDTAPANDDENDITTAGSLQFDFKAVEAATDKFSYSNKLGQGGFGEVFKGTFPNGVQVAVKRLSKKSGQGEREFKNEVVVVAKLQHRNLVRLLGFSLQGEERLLVYEFVPKKSLDYFLFDSEKQSQLDWTKRYKIIGGIARGILYLHQDSRLTIIHRDLKAGNILLDDDMNPKIADFGMARIFGVEQSEANTGRIVGTYGYMSPEYAMYGQFSMKSDVYSFGVLVLEIISGKKNSKLYEISNTGGNMVTHAWRLWKSGSPLELVDQNIKENHVSNDVIRCIHIALLCVQEDPEDRPTMSSIVQMLTTSSLALHVPRPPGLFIHSEHESNLVTKNVGTSSSTSNSLPFSTNDASITSLGPR